MKVNTFRYSLSLIIVFVFISSIISCKKDDDDGPAVKTRKEMLSKEWIQTDLIATVGSLSESVYDSEFEACEQDNIYFFKADGTFTVTENTTKCDAADPDLVTSGTWKLLENDTKIEIDPATEDPRVLNIVELTETTLKGSITENSNGVDIQLTGVYAAK